MKITGINTTLGRAILLTSSALSLGLHLRGAQRFTVTVVDRENRESRYAYVVPGTVTQNSTTNVNCSGSFGVTCSGTTVTTASGLPARTVTYSVAGATLALRLSDGRIAVVNCDGKFNWTDWNHMNQVQRSCRIPAASELQAEFNGDKAKLSWPVSIDGKKMESETYKIVGVLSPQTESAR